MKKIQLLFLSLMFLPLLSSCSSMDSDVKDFLRCGIAASQLEENRAASIISKKADDYFDKNKSKFEKHLASKGMQSTPMYLSFLSNDIRNEEMELYNKNLQGQIFTLVKVYNSSTCLKLHEQDKIKMPFQYYLSYFFI